MDSERLAPRTDAEKNQAAERHYRTSRPNVNPDHADPVPRHLTLDEINDILVGAADPYGPSVRKSALRDLAGMARMFLEYRDDMNAALERCNEVQKQCLQAAEQTADDMAKKRVFAKTIGRLEALVAQRGEQVAAAANRELDHVATLERAERAEDIARHLQAEVATLQAALDESAATINELKRQLCAKEGDAYHG